MKKFRLTSLFKFALPVLLVATSAAVTGPILVSCSNNKSSSTSPVPSTPNYNDEATFLSAAKSLHFTTMANVFCPYSPVIETSPSFNVKERMRIEFDIARDSVNGFYHPYCIQFYPDKLPNRSSKSGEILLVDPDNLPNITKFKNEPDPVEAFKDYVSIGPSNPIFKQNKDLFKYNDKDKRYCLIDSFAKSECWEKYPVFKFTFKNIEWINSWDWNGFNPIPSNNSIYKISGWTVSYWKNGEYIENEIINPNIAFYGTVFEEYEDPNDTAAAIQTWKKFFAKNINRYPAVINNNLWVYSQKLMFPEFFEN